MIHSIHRRMGGKQETGTGEGQGESKRRMSMHGNYEATLRDSQCDIHYLNARGRTLERRQEPG